MSAYPPTVIYATGGTARLDTNEVLRGACVAGYKQALNEVLEEVETRWRGFANKNVAAGGGKYDMEISTLLSLKVFLEKLTE